MESRSRTEYSARNSSVALISQLIHLLVGFLLRIVFTHTLSKDYVGVNGLFLDIIFILSLSELGVGTAITYALYRPIEEGDIEKQKSLMRLFRKFYHMVAAIVLGLGLLLIPFMDIIIKDPPNVEHLTIIYLFYLASSVSSYLLIYKRTLMDAHQMAYIGTLYTTASWVIQDLIQILVLVWTHNFLLFLSINLIVTITTNILISRKADRLYPYLREKDVEPLPKEEKQEIRKNVGAMFLHKMSNVVVNNTDNLLISAFVGIVSVGKYSNYVLITSSLRNIVRSFFQGIMASVGNLGVSKDKGNLGRIFHATLFINQWVSCFVTITLFEIFNLFVAIFFGEQYVFDLTVVAMICLNFYLGSLREGILVFRDSLGVFWYDRYKAVAEAIINLVVSVILAKYMGTAGVLLGTVISTLSTSAWVEPYMLYKHRLGVSLWEFWKRMLVYVPVSAGVLFLTDWVCNLYEGKAWQMLLYRMVVCMFVPNLLLFILYYRNRELAFLLEKAKELLPKRTKSAQTRGVSKGQMYFLHMLEVGLQSREASDEWSEDDATVQDAIRLARSQGLITFAHDFFLHQKPHNSKQYVSMTEPASKQMVLNNYRLWQQVLHLHQLFEARGIPYLLLKGPSVSFYYPVPELRKSGDLDIWVYQPGTKACEGEVYFGPNFDAMEQVLLADGYHRNPYQHANHHVSFLKPGMGEVEVHVLWIEDFQSASLNRAIAQMSEDAYLHAKYLEIGPGQRIHVLSDQHQACHILLHMLQHYVIAGFGWKLLCDWNAFWNSVTEDEVYEYFMKQAKDWQVQTFVTYVTWICKAYLGLREDAAARLMTEPMNYAACMELMAELFAAGEFGEGEAGRMVAPKGRGPLAMLSEFHHQMKRNHYEASKQIWRWPYLWVITFVTFVKNNHRLRNISTTTVIKNASRRSKLRKKMQLFKEQ